MRILFAAITVLLLSRIDASAGTDYATQCVKVNQVVTSWGEPAQEMENTCLSKIRVFFCHASGEKQDDLCGSSDKFYQHSMFLDGINDGPYYKWSNHITMPDGVVLVYKACWSDSRHKDKGDGELECSIPSMSYESERQIMCGDTLVNFKISIRRPGEIKIRAHKREMTFRNLPRDPASPSYNEIVAHLCRESGVESKPNGGAKVVQLVKEIVYPMMQESTEDAHSQCQEKFDQKSCESYKFGKKDGRG